MSLVNVPQTEFLDPITKRPSRPWFMWLMSPSVYQISTQTPISVLSGGTGTADIPTNGQLLIGNGTNYTVNNLNHGDGISVTNGAGTISIANTGVLSFSADSTGLTPATPTTGNVVLGGILNAPHGGTGFGSYAVGDTLYASATNALSKFSKPSATSYYTMGSSGVPTWKNPAYGGFYDTTNQTSTAGTATAITFNSTYVNDGIAIGTPTSRIVVSRAGLYNIQFSIQFANTNAAADNVVVWLKFNGANTPNTSSWITVPGKHAGDDGQALMSLNIFLPFAVNDYFELYWQTVLGHAFIETIASGTNYPASPGVILTVSDNIKA